MRRHDSLDQMPIAASPATQFLARSMDYALNRKRLPRVDLPSVECLTNLQESHVVRLVRPCGTRCESCCAEPQRSRPSTYRTDDSRERPSENGRERLAKNVARAAALAPKRPI